MYDGENLFFEKYKIRKCLLWENSFFDRNKLFYFSISIFPSQYVISVNI